MRGKRSRTTSSSPTYERVVWQEKKTGRGSKIAGRVVVSPGTPKAKKPLTPRSKRWRVKEGLSTTTHPDREELPIASPIPIKLPQKRGGKVFSFIS